MRVRGAREAAQIANQEGYWSGSLVVADGRLRRPRSTVPDDRGNVSVAVLAGSRSNAIASLESSLLRSCSSAVFLHTPPLLTTESQLSQIEHNWFASSPEFPTPKVGTRAGIQHLNIGVRRPSSSSLTVGSWPSPYGRLAIRRRRLVLAVHQDRRGRDRQGLVRRSARALRPISCERVCAKRLIAFDAAPTPSLSGPARWASMKYPLHNRKVCGARTQNRPDGRRSLPSLVGGRENAYSCCSMAGREYRIRCSLFLGCIAEASGAFNQDTSPKPFS